LTITNNTKSLIKSNKILTTDLVSDTVLICSYLPREDLKTVRFIKILEMMNYDVYEFNNKEHSLREPTDELINITCFTDYPVKKVVIIYKENETYRKDKNSIPMISNSFNVFMEFTQKNIKLRKNRYGKIGIRKYEELYTEEIRYFEESFDKKFEDFNDEEMSVLEIKFSI